MSKKVLILAYKFPPMGTIGTRRWAKFAKYLANNGYQVHILARRYKYNDTVNWSADIVHDNIKVTYFETIYPMVCIKNSKNIAEKVLCKILNIFRERFLSKLDIADAKSIDFFTKANTIIKEENIVNVIVTAPPHTFSYYATIVKSENPNINLIVDYRDPWNYFTPYTLKNSNNFKLKEKSIAMETQVVSMANHILCVTSDMTNSLKNLYPEHSNKIQTLYNGFDKDDYLDIKVEEKDKNYIEILYAGAFEAGRIEAIKLIAEALNDYTQELNVKFILYSNISINTFVGFKYLNIIKKYFIFNSFISQKEILEKIADCDICLSINSPDNIHAFGTKIFDYFALNKPIWHISNGGELFELLKHNNQFVSTYDKVDILYFFDKIGEIDLQNIKQKFVYERFSLDEVTIKLINLLYKE